MERERERERTEDEGRAWRERNGVGPKHLWSCEYAPLNVYERERERARQRYLTVCICICICMRRLVSRPLVLLCEGKGDWSSAPFLVSLFLKVCLGLMTHDRYASSKWQKGVVSFGIFLGEGLSHSHFYYLHSSEVQIVKKRGG